MSFVLREASTFEWPVKFSVPEKGKHKAAEYTGEFLILDTDEIQKIVRDQDADKGNAALIERVLVSVSNIDIRDADDNAITDMRDKVAIIARNPLTSGATVEAYFKGLAGHRAKN